MTQSVLTEICDRMPTQEKNIAAAWAKQPAMAQELESHMRKEENVLFPMIVAGRGALAAVPIRVMRMEHDDHGVAVRALEKISNGMQAPSDACATWRALYAGLRTFRDDLLAHIDTENNLLFERFAPAAAP